ncbi:hypothetical protein VYU27_005714 [Nannochloropsis oceanica]
MSPISRIHQHRGGRPRWQKGVLVGLSTGLTIVYVIFVVLSGRYALFQLTSEGDREHHKISLLSQAQSQQGTNAPQPQPAAQAPAAKPRCDPKPSADPEHALQPLLSAPALEAGVHSIIPIEKGTLECTDSPPRQRGEDGSIVYWRKWTEETMWSSPFKPKGDEGPKYVTFEPDEGGFNNIRMALEIFLLFALATGRTLVLPDEYPMYLLGQAGIMHDFDDFYDVDGWKRNVDVLPMHKFLEIEGLTGQLKNGEMPPGNATRFDRRRPLWEYIRRATDMFPVGPDSHVVALDLPTNITTVEELMDYRPDFETFSHGRQLLQYGPELQAKKSLHFTSAMDGGKRYLAHFYSFLYFADPQVDAFMKRFVRDHMHYKDEIFCRAAKVVDLLHAEGKDGAFEPYDAIHIRRGDFQFTETRLEAEDIFRTVEDVVVPGSLVYVVTDETNATFFDTVRNRYRLRFYKDFYAPDGLGDMNPNLAGMVEQIIASGARTFVGTYFSTFTGYITRMRGYLSKNPGYYYLKPYKDALQSPAKEFYASDPNFRREWPAAYEGIDQLEMKDD